VSSYIVEKHSFPINISIFKKKSMHGALIYKTS